MFPEIVKDIETLSFRSDILCASLMHDTPCGTKKEINSLKEKYNNLSAKVLAHQEKMNCINLMKNQPDCQSSVLVDSISIKTASFHSKISEIRRNIQSCEEEFMLQKVFKSLEQKNYREAQLRCEQVLAIKPWHEKARKILSDISYESDPQIKLAVESSLQNFKFQFVHSFGQDILSEPHHLHVSEDGKTLFVSDNGNKTVHLFSAEGEYLGQSSISITAPSGLFSGETNQVWVCDLESQRLIEMNQQGEKQAEIYLPDYLEEGCKTTYPCWGTYSNGITTLILSDRNFNFFAVRSFSREEFKRQPYNDSLDEIDVPCGVEWYKNSLLLGSKSQGCLYVSSNEAGQFIRLGMSVPSNQLKAFTIVKNSFFLNYGNTLVKLNCRGDVIFSVDLEAYTGRSFCLNFGIASTVGNGEEILFVPDGLNKCIHAFSV